jgi:ATP-dependent Clp protease ATP-binding subunit ClpC
METKMRDTIYLGELAMHKKNIHSLLRPFLAVTLSALLIAISPGAFAYQAFAAVLSGAASAGRSAAVSASGAGASLRTQPLSGVNMALSPSTVLSLQSTLPSSQPSLSANSALSMTAAQAAVTAPNAAALNHNQHRHSPAAAQAPLIRGAGRLAPTPTATAKTQAPRQGFTAAISGLVKRYAPNFSKKTPQAAAASSRQAFDNDALRRQGVTATHVQGSLNSARNSGLKAADNEPVAAATFEVAAPKPIYTPKAKPWHKTKLVQVGAPVAVGVGVVAANILFPALLTGTLIGAGLMGSILLHEFSHLAALRYFGEPTARENGFNTLNPLKLVDPLGTLVLPALSALVSLPLFGIPLIFGWAKPVPVDFNLLKDPKRDAGWIALAGPASNLALAGLFGAAYFAMPLLGITSAVALSVTSLLALMNVALFVVNMLPLPWLDGFKVFVGFLMPQSLYQKWIYNPRVVTPYQKLYQRIYQGPSNVLSRFNIDTMDQISGLTRALSIAVMGLVSAGLWMGLGVPFLFLALPCSYDYYCIREKVRSEAAVEEMMDLMSEWGTLLVQIAEDHDAESEVSAYEAEHAMKNAVDQLLEDMMAKQSFRDLDDEEKIAEFMRAYPDMAVQFLKQKVFTEDSEDKIREILADERNTVMFDRVAEWLRKWEVFKKMSSPTEKKKLKDANQDADEKRSQEQGGGGSLGGFAALFGFALASSPAALTGPIEGLFAWIAAMGIGAGAVFLAGTTTGNGDAPRDGPEFRTARNAENPARFWVAFKEGVTRREAEVALDRAGLTAEDIVSSNRPVPVGETSPAPYFKAQILMHEARQIAPSVRFLLADRDLIDAIIVHNDVRDDMPQDEEALVEDETQQELFEEEVFGDVPAIPADAALSRAANDGAITDPSVLTVTLNRNLERVEGNNFLMENGLDEVGTKIWVNERELQVNADSAQQAAAVALQLLRDHRVARVGLHQSVRAALLNGEREETNTGAVDNEPAAAETEAAAETPAPGASTNGLDRRKIVQANNSNGPRGRFWVHFARGTLEPQARAIARRLGLGDRMRNVTPASLGNLMVSMEIEVNDAVTAGRKALLLSREAGVHKVAIHTAAYGFLRLGQQSTSSAAADTPQEDGAAEEPAEEDVTPEPEEIDPNALAPEIAAKIRRGNNSQTTTADGVSDLYWAYVAINDTAYNAKNILKGLDVKPVGDGSEKRRFDSDHTEGTGTTAVTTVRVLTDSIEDLKELVRGLADHSKIVDIRTFPEVADMLNPAAAHSHSLEIDREKITADGDAIGRLQIEGSYEAGAASLEESLRGTDNVDIDSSANRFRFTAQNVAEAAQMAARWSTDSRITSVMVHPDVDAHLAAQERLAASENPTSKVEQDENLPDRKDLAIIFKDDASETVREGFLKDHVLARALKYRWDNGDLIVHVREMTAAGAVLGAATANDNIVSVRMNEMGLQSVEGYKTELPESFEFGPETLPKDSPKGVDENRAVLVRFNAEATSAEHIAISEQFGLRTVEVDYRGEERAVLYEAPEVADPSFFLRTLTEATANNTAVESLTLLREPELDAATAGEEFAASLGSEENTGPIEVARRDAHAEWVKFLQDTKLTDGESNFNSKQIELLTAFLKPVAPQPNEKRHPVIGRVAQMKRAIRTLTGPRGRITSVMLTGVAGTGKTAIFEGLAQLMEDAEHANSLRVANNDGTSEFLDIARLRGRWFIELDIDRLLAEDDPVPVLLGIMELLPLLNNEDPREGNRVMLLLDETQKLRLDPKGVKIMNALKGPIRSGTVAIAGTTTDDEWKEYFESDQALESRFRRIPVEEPTSEETIEMLRGAKVDFEWRHSAKIDDEALVATAKLTDEYWQDKANPRKSFDYVLPDAAERMNPDVLRAEIALDIREGWRNLAAAVRQAARGLVDKGIASSISLPAETYNQIAAQVHQILEWYQERDGVEDGEGHVTVNVVKRTIAELTGIEAGQLTMDEEDTGRYVEMEDTLREDVVNQDNALLAVARAIRRNKSGLGDPSKPMGKFLFVGPTGVGKTHVVKMLAKFLFEDEDAIVRFDMSEFMEEHTYMRLVGAPPSYVGYEGGGQLTEAVRKRPYTVVLFDEIEKAHPKVWNIFLQILDDGRLTDSKGRTVDFKNTVIVFTSNIGMDLVDSEAYAGKIEKLEEAFREIEATIASGVTEGLGDLVNKKEEIRKEITDIETAWDTEISAAIKESIKAKMKPELINRLDPDPTSKAKWVRFNRLNRDNADLITKIEMNRFKKLLLARHDTELLWDEEVKTFIADYGFSAIYGARPLKETIEKFIVDPLAEWTLKEMASGNDVKGKRIHVSMSEGVPVFTAEEKPVVEVARNTLEGLAHTMTEKVMELVEGMAGENLGELAEDQPAPVADEATFDNWLRELTQPAETTQEEDKPAAPQAVFNPNLRVSLPEGATRVAGEHNNPKKADKTLRAEIRRLGAAAKSEDYSTEALDVLNGESFAKQFVRWAKTRAADDGSPVALASVMTAGAMRIVVESEHVMSEDEKQHLGLHFSGTPPASLREAQQAVDRINMTASKIRDHNLLDLYRRVSAIPGARLGFASNDEGTQYWIEIPKEAPQTSAPVDAAPQASGRSLQSAPEPQQQLTGHQQQELTKAKELLLRMLNSNHQDGPAIMIAAADAWAMLSTPADGAMVRRWIVENRWADKATGDTKLAAQADMLMAMAHWMKRHGTVEDIDTLESILQRFTTGSHFKVPARSSVMLGLSELYVRAGAERARAAYDAEGQNVKVKEAAALALGRVGTMVDADRVKGNSQAELDLLSRWDPAALRKFYAENWPATDEKGKTDFATKFKGLSADAKKLLLKYVAQGTGRDDYDLYVLHQLVNSADTDRSTSYYLGEAIADIARRRDMRRALSSQLSEFMGKHDMTGYDEKWKVQLAYLYAAQRVGGADALPIIEDIMDRDPTDISTNYEQPYFETPMTWAKIVVRSGLFSTFAAPQRGSDGAIKPSKLQEFLTSQRPMKIAAALYAIGLERSRLGGGEVEEDISPLPEGNGRELPDLYIAGAGKPNQGYNYAGYRGMGGGMMGFAPVAPVAPSALPNAWTPVVPDIAGWGPSGMTWRRQPPIF